MYLKLIFVYGVRKGLKFILFLDIYPVVAANLLKLFFFPHWIILAPLLKIYWLCVSLFLYNLLCSIDLFVYLYANTTLYLFIALEKFWY